jgi:nitroreductase
VPQELVNRLIEAARWAPSGLNNQPWKFKIITAPERKAGLSRFTDSRYTIKYAPVVIAFFMDRGFSYNRDKDLMAIGASVQNILLEAASLGLGSCWLGEIVNKKDRVSRFLGTDNNLEFLGAVAIGYPARKKKRAARRKVSSFILKD